MVEGERTVETGAGAEPVTVWGMIDARPVVFPVSSRDMNALTMSFRTDVDRVTPFLRGAAFAPVVERDGLTGVLVALHEYRSGDWGPMNTVDVCLSARPAAGPGPAGLLLHEAPINQPFGNEASYWSMGIPHRPGPVEVTRTDDEIEFRVDDQATGTLTVYVRRPQPPSTWVSLSQRLYTYVDGVAHVVPLDIGFPTAALDAGAVRAELGEGPLADDLRAMGMLEGPLACTWGEAMPIAFHLPRPLAPPGTRLDDDVTKPT